ncbi:hypothetical protein EYR36_002178 [Pleurotus pulmonarius]|nr:hypothetical protein EYR36_002178 [Pleurotus pulmonarius]
MQNWQADLLAEQRRYRVLLNEHQLRRVQFASSNILLEAFAAGTLCTMNDEVLRRRAEPTSGGRPTPLTLHKHALSSHRLDMLSCRALMKLLRLPLSGMSFWALLSSRFAATWILEQLHSRCCQLMFLPLLKKGCLHIFYV